MKVKSGTTGIPWCDFQGSGSSLFQEMQPVTRAPRSQTMMQPMFACGGRDGVRPVETEATHSVHVFLVS